LLNLNYIPVPIAPYLAKSASPENIVYADPKLAPGGEGGAPRVPEYPPAVSAYTGLDGDVPLPPGMGAPPSGPFSAPERQTNFPIPALYPGAPVPTDPPRIGPPVPPPASGEPVGAPGLPGMMLPAPPPDPGPPPGPLLPAEGTPPS
jgi:phospholipid/cholesterol/gamma-HCH transport system substrate-binding protein